MLKPISDTDLIAIVGSVTRRDGWDFSRMNESFGTAPWRYEEELAAFIDGTTRLLDQGTGGGELLLRLAPDLGDAIGIDAATSMIETAERNRLAQAIDNVSFVHADSRATPFDSRSFDVIANRHSTFAVDESARLLDAGGIFITQQVGYANADDLFGCFVWRDEFPHEWREPIDSKRVQFEAAGFDVLRTDEYRIDWWIHDIESLVFWLQSVPTPSPFTATEHIEGINRAIAELADERGIRTVEHRELLIAQRAFR